MVYDIPWLADRHDVLGSVLGGWQVSSVLNFRTGEPLRITQASGIANSRPDYNGGNQIFDNWRDTMQYLDRSAYTGPDLADYGGDGAAGQPELLRVQGRAVGGWT